MAGLERCAMTIDKLTDAMRRVGLHNALVDENHTHFLIATTPEQIAHPVTINRMFVECARQQELDAVLREKFGLVP